MNNDTGPEARTGTRGAWWSSSLIALTGLAGHRLCAPTGDLEAKAAGCGTGFGFFKETGTEHLVPVGTRKASFGIKDRDGKDGGMLKLEARLSNPKGSVSNDRFPVGLDGHVCGEGPQQVVREWAMTGVSWF